MDADTANMIGYYESKRAALRDVAEIVRDHGPESRAVRDLVVYRDGTDEPGLSGPALVHEALAWLSSESRAYVPGG